MARRIVGVALRLLAGIALLGGGYHYGARQTVANMAAPSPVDVGFAQFMRGHHDQAVVMTQILLGRGTTRLVGLARSIQTAQLIEIGEMKGWLLLWGKPVLPATTSMDWMLFGKNAPDAELARYLSDCRSSPGGMPGMASTQELNELRQLDGEARDQLFLRLMMRHHQGGLPMAHFAARNARADAVRTLAAAIEVQQMQELVAMAVLQANQPQNGLGKR